ncbi:hypothetical protein EYF80_047326 [Liparis tanakae]|uniref:Uncharacterized protein n=1 Tax=Liparis tanakae TaxID=230148 RepID=A0A4Z2FQ89_9TELE|nr:hypothetical protein EYF80_047326 [Liparis tanakae]
MKPWSSPVLLDLMPETTQARKGDWKKGLLQGAYHGIRMILCDSVWYNLAPPLPAFPIWATQSETRTHRPELLPRLPALRLCCQHVAGRLNQMGEPSGPGHVRVHLHGQQSYTSLTGPGDSPESTNA